MRNLIAVAGAALVSFVIGACAGEAASTPADRHPPGGTLVEVTDTMIADAFDAAGVAEPVRAASLSTKLMATVTDLPVHEGDHVAADQILVRLDARDLEAKRVQVEAGLAAAVALHHDAETHAARMRALFADSAATKAQLDQAETGLARAQAAVAGARAQAVELAATASYADVRAPFAGVVTRRFVDRGSFAAPGTPLVRVEDASTLRVSVSAAPADVRGLRRGGIVEVTIAGVTATATVEGVVPAGSNLYNVNALLPNGDGRFLSGSAAVLALPRGSRRAILVPERAIVRQGELTGVRVLTAGRRGLRWIRLGATRGAAVEILSGLVPGDTIVVPGGEG